MDKHIIKAFNLPSGLWIDRVETLAQEIIIHCRRPSLTALCPSCGQTTAKIHQIHLRKVKHSQLDFKQVILLIKVKRYKCRYCTKVFTEKMAGLDKKRTTINFRLQALSWLTRNSFNYIGQRFNISPSTLTRYLVEMHKDYQIDWQKLKIAKLGIDEHSFKGRNLVITITDITNHKLLAILTNDNQETLSKFLENIPIKAKKQIKEVCIDICQSYRSVIKKHLPQAKIVADRFHVENLAKRALDDIRQVIQIEEGKRKIHLKELLMKNQEQLKGNEIKRLNLAFEKYQHYPVLKEAWFIKEKIRRIYWSKDKDEALEKFQQVIMFLETAKSNIYLKTLLKTLKSWKQEILNYFANKTTNGFTEGCHTKIKMLKRVSFGFRNINNYIAKMTLAFMPLLWIINYHTI